MHPYITNVIISPERNVREVPEGVDVVPEAVDVVPEGVNFVPEAVDVVPEGVNFVPEAVEADCGNECVSLVLGCAVAVAASADRQSVMGSHSTDTILA